MYNDMYASISTCVYLCKFMYASVYEFCIHQYRLYTCMHVYVGVMSILSYFTKSYWCRIVLLILYDCILYIRFMISFFSFGCCMHVPFIPGAHVLDMQEKELCMSVEG